MEAIYGVTVKNRYQFFIDGDAGQLKDRKQQDDKKSKEKSAKNAKTDKPKTKPAKSNQETNKTPQQSQNAPETKVNVDQNQNKRDGKCSSQLQKLRFHMVFVWQLAHDFAAWKQTG